MNIDGMSVWVTGLTNIEAFSVVYMEVYNSAGRQPEVQLPCALPKVEAHSKLWVAVQWECHVLHWEKVVSVGCTFPLRYCFLKIETMCCVGVEAYSKCRTLLLSNLTSGKECSMHVNLPEVGSIFQRVCDSLRKVPCQEQWEKPWTESNLPQTSFRKTECYLNAAWNPLAYSWHWDTS